MHGPIYLDEKATAGGLPISEHAPQQKPRRRQNRLTTFFWAVLVSAFLFFTARMIFDIAEDIFDNDELDRETEEYYKNRACQQVDPLFPAVQSDKLLEMEAIFDKSDFYKLSAGRLSGAVQIPTQSFDDNGEVGEDKRYEAMFKFAEYLEKTFPRVHTQLKVEKVNTHGLLYTWNGSEPALKPTLLMAHQDTVPVPDVTIDQWTYPPWSGHFDGTFVWGRGAADCKNQLIAVLTGIEALLSADFAPKRTILLSFGFDEEVSGPQGAGHLSKHILDRYGPDSLAVIVDEGMGISEDWGVALAQPGVAEKGYTDVQIVIRTPGGHSSVPPDHTGIGILSELITLIEAHPYETFLDKKNPYLGKLQCGARFGPDFPNGLRKLLPRVNEEGEMDVCRKHGHHDHDHKHGHHGHHDHDHDHDSKPPRPRDPLAYEAAKQSPFARYLMQTSVAVDLISGGVKINALPERVTTTVNHRVNIGERPADVHNRIIELSKQIGEKYNLTVNAFNGGKEEQRSITLINSRDTLEAAPVTPTNVDTLTPYAILSGTTRALYGEDLVVSPGLMTGNTDTRYYWDLTRHIFRWGPAWVPGDGKDGGLARSGVHTVDERMNVAAHVNGVKWFVAFVRNMDEAAL